MRWSGSVVGVGLAALVALPFIDGRQNPQGRRRRSRALISGGLTVREATRLAGLIGSGPLPAQLIER